MYKQHVKFFFTATLILLVSFAGICQMNQSEYLEAKRQFSLENYEAARLGFKNLVSDPTFGSYASFYYALSARKKGDYMLAYNMWKQVLTKYTNWKQKDEVVYWLANTSFYLKKYEEGFGYYDMLPKNLKTLTKQECLYKLSTSELREAYQANNTNEVVATLLYDSLSTTTLEAEDSEMMKEIAEKYNLSKSVLSSDLPIIKKEKYAIAVVLPFMFESLESPQNIIKNSLIWELYEGMRLAQSDLKEKGIDLEIFPYDTKKSKSATQALIDKGYLTNADAIIGPLYEAPNKLIKEFSKNQKINMINPISSNSDVISNNPFAFLFHPSYETQGKFAAKYACKRFKKNKKAFIFYETKRDSILAKSYLDELEANNFFVIRFEQITNEKAQIIRRDFTQTNQIRLSKSYTEEEIDSARLNGRYIKSKLLRRNNTGALIKDENGDPITVFYENRFRIKKDSIGHVFVATSSNLLANNFISLSEIRNDTIGLIGYDNWLSFSTTSYNQLERLGVAFISPSLVNKDTEDFDTVKNSFINTIGCEPGEYHVIGYELVYQLGLLFSENGKYFQRGLMNNEYKDGKLMYGLKYGSNNDNQIVPVTKLEKLELINQLKNDKD